MRSGRGAEQLGTTACEIACSSQVIHWRIPCVAKVAYIACLPNAAGKYIENSINLIQAYIFRANVLAFLT